MAIKILLVLDGEFRFAAAPGEFSYEVLFGALDSAGFDVTKAHRRDLGEPNVTKNFTFTAASLAPFDLLWLIGDEGVNGGNDSGTKIGASEVLAIAEYMEAGGGVFATGDHDGIGSKMCGQIPRVRVMRKWFATGDPDKPAGFPSNWPAVGAGRADTIQPNALGDGGTYFENQSDSTPQPIQRVPPEGPTHPILINDDHDIEVLPDHMHEGDCIAGWDGFDWGGTPIDGSPIVEFRTLTGDPNERPQVIATGEGLGHATPAGAGAFGEDTPATPKTIGVLAAYDGFSVGVGRIVTGSTFHHYVDLNLTGDARVDTQDEFDTVGEDAKATAGFAWPGAEATFADIKAVYVNIANWLARPRRAIRLILDRNTFGQDEVHASLADTEAGVFARSFFVAVEGFRPSDFPGGLDSLTPSQADLESWAPDIPNPHPGIEVEVTGVSSSDPQLLERFQTFTFEYSVRFPNESAFGFGDPTEDRLVTASLTLGTTAMSDSGVIRLVKTANPFMLDLADGNDTVWLSSDLRLFTLTEGSGRFGKSLPDGATPADAAAFIAEVIEDITPAQFAGLPLGQAQSPLSPYPTADNGKTIYNFAIARVRLRGEAAIAEDVRVFFRIFESQTTAALTYNGPVGSYLRTDPPDPIALPGESGGQYISFPCFATARDPDPANQDDEPNRQQIDPTPGDTTLAFFGCLIDNNVDVPYLPPAPGSVQPKISLSDLLAGAHQCIVAQIEYEGTAIPVGANPATSDKLAQRNIALDHIANPGRDASRVATHTFEIAATPDPIREDWRPDELMLEWRGPVPEGARVSFYLPTCPAASVIALADRLYTRHELRALDDRTIEVPAGGIRYIPLPQSLSRQVGLMSVAFPLGVRKGERYDCLVRQVTNRMRRVDQPPAKISRLDREAALKIVQAGPKPRLGMMVVPAYQMDMAGTDPVLVEIPRAAEAQQAVQQRWREVVGAFQLGIPVGDTRTLLLPTARLLSLMSWRALRLRPQSRWYPVFRRYLQILEDKVRALGGDPLSVPPTPGGVWEGMPEGYGPDGHGGGDGKGDTPHEHPGHHGHVGHHGHHRHWAGWLALAVSVAALAVAILG
ncbi:MAG TPA: hypothetical protein VD887_05175 [Allosphingosinicella sp.]|nr:hypothetical protein [Allosphingosinicella sp.]